MMHTRTHTQTFNIKTPCPATRAEITLTLHSDKSPKSQYIEGKPTECSLKLYCKHTTSAKCYLKAVYIKGRKKRGKK